MKQKIWNACKMIGFGLLLIYGSVLYYQVWGLLETILSMNEMFAFGAGIVLYFGCALPAMMVLLRYLDEIVTEWMNHHIHGYHDFSAYQ